MDITTLVGTIGASLILVAFILNQTHVWKDDFLWYDVVNLLGALLLLVYAIILRSYPFIVLQGIWALVSLRDIMIDIKRKAG